MTATIPLQQHANAARAAGPQAEQTIEPSGNLSFGALQARTLPSAILLTFALIAGAMYLYRGDVLGAIGLGAFMSFWLGGGFGFLVGGVLYGLQAEAHE